MHRFSASYLHESRRGLWDDDREALAPIALDRHDRILDVGAGTGALTRLLREETDAYIISLDADRTLLAEVTAGNSVLGDATRLPIETDAVDLAVCQALLVNLPDPVAAVSEFGRASADLVAAIEPDNGAVAIDSTVGSEADLARQARSAYIDGHGPDATLGGDAAAVFREAGLHDVRTRRHVRQRTIAPPYDEAAVREARRRVRATRIEANRETFLSGSLTEAEFERLREEWRSMGRTVVDQMTDRTYQRTETLPLFVTVGRIDEADRGGPATTRDP